MQDFVLCGFARAERRGRGCWPNGAKGFVPRLAGYSTWGSVMTILARAAAFGCSLVLDQAGVSSTRLALVIGLASSAVLILVRVAAAAATMPIGH